MMRCLSEGSIRRRMPVIRVRPEGSVEWLHISQNQGREHHGSKRTRLLLMAVDMGKFATNPTSAPSALLRRCARASIGGAYHHECFVGSMIVEYAAGGTDHRGAGTDCTESPTAKFRRKHDRRRSRRSGAHWGKLDATGAERHGAGVPLIAGFSWSASWISCGRGGKCWDRIDARRAAGSP